LVPSTLPRGPAHGDAAVRAGCSEREAQGMSVAVSAGLIDATRKLDRTAQQVAQLAKEVRDGMLQQKLDAARRRHKARQRNRPYSAWLAQPYVKVAAAAHSPYPDTCGSPWHVLGCVQSLRLGSQCACVRRRGGGHKSGSQLSEFIPTGSCCHVCTWWRRCLVSPGQTNAAVGCIARMPMPSFRPLAAAAEPDATPGDAEARIDRSLAGRVREAWAPYLRDTALRMFASAGVSAQMGRFTRRVADFTAVSLRLDAGLTSPKFQALAGACAAPRRPSLE
jgi:hypothetical protein